MESRPARMPHPVVDISADAAAAAAVRGADQGHELVHTVRVCHRSDPALAQVEIAPAPR
jgi:hypothetical protein